MTNPRLSKEQQKERIRQRVRVQIDEANYNFIPEVKPPDYRDNDAHLRVVIYVRVSTDDVRQTTSFELQRKYYEDFVRQHPKWTLVGIFADEGISGTSLKKRKEFNRMIEVCKAGKADLIITKSVSRFARNVVDFLGMARMLAERQPPVGVFFEAENIYSLNDNSNMALSFQATMAEEESRNKSRSMETSLRMRLDHGLPLTPKLLGFAHDDQGKLVPNLDTYRTPKLMFYMYLYGYSTKQIAEALIHLGRKSYRGNIKWTANGVVNTLRNERYCGDVYTRKTFTPDVLSHRSVKNRGERPRSQYFGEHEAIITRDDFIAVQHLLNNAKYRNKNILPELRVIPEGLLKGYVIINPRWAGFKEPEYIRASASAYEQEDVQETIQSAMRIQAEAGDFDMRGFEVAHTDLFDGNHSPFVSFANKGIKFSMECVRRMPTAEYVELLIHPFQKRLAVRPTTQENRNAVKWVKTMGDKRQPREISCAAFYDTLFRLFEWNLDHKYRMFSALRKRDSEESYIFSADEAVVYIPTETFAPQAEYGEDNALQPINVLGKHIRGIPSCWMHAFGNGFYEEMSYEALAHQTREEWQLRIEGQLCNVGMKLNVTDYDTLREFIENELGDWSPQEEQYNE